MKGIVFTELLEMVEDVFGFEVAEEVVEKSNLPNEGMYLAAGTYPHAELVTIVQHLSVKTKMDIPSLLQAFGKHLFKRLVDIYPASVEGHRDSLDLIASVDEVIHVEVRKLYPDAELPHFVVKERTETQLIMDYTSGRKMEDFAIGLMQGCADYFEDTITITQKAIPAAEVHTIEFTITKS